METVFRLPLSQFGQRIATLAVMAANETVYRLVAALKEVHSQPAKELPFGQPNPGASESEIKAFEQEFGFTLPPHYRDFLLLCDGWPAFEGMRHLFSIKELRSEHRRQEQKMIIDVLHESFVLEEYGFEWNEEKDDYQNLLLFGGIEGTGDDFLIAVKGESYGKVFWTAGYVVGDPSDNFADFLKEMLDLCRGNSGSYSYSYSYS